MDVGATVLSGGLEERPAALSEGSFECSVIARGVGAGSDDFTELRIDLAPAVDGETSDPTFSSVGAFVLTIGAESLSGGIAAALAGG